MGLNDCWNMKTEEEDGLINNDYQSLFPTKRQGER